MPSARSPGAEAQRHRDEEAPLERADLRDVALDAEFALAADHVAADRRGERRRHAAHRLVAFRDVAIDRRGCRTRKSWRPHGQRRAARENHGYAKSFAATQGSFRWPKQLASLRWARWARRPRAACTSAARPSSPRSPAAAPRARRAPRRRARFRCRPTTNSSAQADVILSIVPPGDAVALAERLAPAIKRAARKTGLCRLQRGLAADRRADRRGAEGHRLHLRRCRHHRPAAGAELAHDLLCVRAGREGVRDGWRRTD